MGEEADKREHSAKPEVDDLTDYQSLNSLGGAGVRGAAKETRAPGDAVVNVESTGAENAASTAAEDEQPAGVEYSGDYNDGADFTTVDNQGRTNS
ncbi:MAG: hypothetical protein ACLGJB_14215 [Blastocatellia bacterium]